MILGNKKYLFLTLFFFYTNLLVAEDKIVTTPLINIEKIKPSFEELDKETENVPLNQKLKEKKNTSVRRTRNR